MDLLVDGSERETRWVIKILGMQKAYRVHNLLNDELGPTLMMVISRLSSSVAGETRREGNGHSIVIQLLIQDPFGLDRSCDMYVVLGRASACMCVWWIGIYTRLGERWTLGFSKGMA